MRDGRFHQYPISTQCLEKLQAHQVCGYQTVLINNAASLQMPKTQDLAELKECSNLNFDSCVTSNILVTKAFLPLLRKSSWPRVIMNSSARGSLGRTATREVRLFLFFLPLSARWQSCLLISFFFFSRLAPPCGVDRLLRVQGCAEHANAALPNSRG